MKLVKKLFVLTIKFIPVMQMAGILVNNILCALNLGIACNIVDYCLGNSISTTILLLICSYTFGFCNWHRLVIYANLVNISIVTLDNVSSLSTTNFQQILLFFTIDIIFILLILINKFKCKK